MLLECFKIKINIYFLLLVLLSSNCKNNSSLDNKINVTIKSKDSKTKKVRKNKSDTIQIRMVKFGFLKKNFVTVGEYVTDSLGTVKVKLNPTEKYHISLYGKNVFGWADFNENVLEDGQTIILKASLPEKRQTR